MKESKKYSIRTLQVKDTWSAEVIRRASARKTIVSKTQAGFKTEAEANEWAETELVLFTAKQSEQNKRRGQKRS